MCVRDCLGHYGRHLEAHLHAAAASYYVCGIQKLQKAGNVIRSPEQEENDHYGDDELDDSVPFGRPHFHQSGNYPRVASHHHQHGNQQTQNICSKQIVIDPHFIVRAVITADRFAILF